MSVLSILKRVLIVVFAVVILSLILGNLLGQPILLSYVESGSMEPTLNKGDGFVTLPTEVAGPINQGDVVVFRAEELQGGGLTTHRIVDETSRGFITKGDANPSVDQATGEPPVKREQIVAVAVQVNGNLLSIPALGSFVEGIQGILQWIQQQLASLLGTSAVLGTQGLAYLLLAITAIIYAIDVWIDSDRRRERSRERESGLNAHLIIGAMALALVLAATATMVIPAGSQQVEIVSSTQDSERPTVLQQGTNDTISLYLSNGGQLPMYSIFATDSERMSVDPSEMRIAPGNSENATIAISAPPEAGAYRYYFTEHRYLAIIPVTHIQSLYAIHPWLPIVVVDAVIAMPVYIIGVLLVGTSQVRNRSRDGPSTTQRFVAKLK